MLVQGGQRQAETTAGNIQQTQLGKGAQPKSPLSTSPNHAKNHNEKIAKPSILPELAQKG